MTLKKYQDFIIPYQNDINYLNNAFPRYNPNIGWYLLPNWTDVNRGFYDGLINIKAENEKAVHDILQEILDTPIQVYVLNSGLNVAPNLDPNPLGD